MMNLEEQIINTGGSDFLISEEAKIEIDPTSIIEDMKPPSPTQYSVTNLNARSCKISLVFDEKNTPYELMGLISSYSISRVEDKFFRRDYSFDILQRVALELVKISPKILIANIDNTVNARIIDFNVSIGEGKLAKLQLKLGPEY